jgi:hypothetical protein
MKSKSARYYAANPDAAKRKAQTDAKINRRPEQVKKRVESNGKRREAKAAGKNVAGKDYDHAVGKFVSVKTNRGRRGEGGRARR